MDDSLINILNKLIVQKVKKVYNIGIIIYEKQPMIFGV